MNSCFNNLIFILVALGALTTGCSNLISAIVNKTEIDMSGDPNYSFLLENTYEFTRDAFVYKERYEEIILWDWSSYDVIGTVELPGNQSRLPYSVADYEQDPKNWPSTDKWAQKGGYLGGRGKDIEIVGIIRGGTPYKVLKIVHVKTASGTTYMLAYLKILEGEFANCIVDTEMLFIGNSLASYLLSEYQP